MEVYHSSLAPCYIPSSTACALRSSSHPSLGPAVWQNGEVSSPALTESDKCHSLHASIFLPCFLESVIFSPLRCDRKWTDWQDLPSPLRAFWTPFSCINELLGLMRPWHCVTKISITSTQFKAYSEWDVFPTQVIYENWDEDEPNNDKGIERCVMFNRSPQMRWNDLYCEYLLNWICETKKGMTTSPFNWSDKHKFRNKLYGFQYIYKKKDIGEFFIVKLERWR